MTSTTSRRRVVRHRRALSQPVFSAEGRRKLAERGGFEPPMQVTPHNRLAIWPVQPLRHLSAAKPSSRRGRAGRLGWANLKTDEAITKARGGRMPHAGRRLLPGILLAAFAILLAAGGAYQAYLHRPTSEAEIAEIETLIKADRGEEARVLMRDAQPRSKDVDALRLRVGRAFLRHGDIGPATALLSQVEPALIKEERLAIAEYFLVKGDPFSAVRFYEAALKTGMPRTASLLGRYGEALALSANGDGAVEAFRESIALDPARASVRVNLAITLANLNRRPEARIEAEAVRKIDPSNDKAIALLTALGAPIEPPGEKNRPSKR